MDRKQADVSLKLEIVSIRQQNRNQDGRGPGYSRILQLNTSKIKDPIEIASC